MANACAVADRWPGDRERLQGAVPVCAGGVICAGVDLVAEVEVRRCTQEHVVGARIDLRLVELPPALYFRVGEKIEHDHVLAQELAVGRAVRPSGDLDDDVV